MTQRIKRYHEPTTRIAVVQSDSSLEAIQSYLPGNYRAVQEGDDIIILGHDDAGWTMNDYVLPRLASGLHFAVEVK